MEALAMAVGMAAFVLIWPVVTALYDYFVEVRKAKAREWEIEVMWQERMTRVEARHAEVNAKIAAMLADVEHCKRMDEVCRWN